MTLEPGEYRAIIRYWTQRIGFTIDNSHPYEKLVPEVTHAMRRIAEAIELLEIARQQPTGNVSDEP